MPEEWCTVYPATGKDEGRFYVTAQVQDQPYPRSCSLIVRDGGGNIVATSPSTRALPRNASKSGSRRSRSAPTATTYSSLSTRMSTGAPNCRCRRRGVGNARQARPGSPTNCPFQSHRTAATDRHVFGSMRSMNLRWSKRSP